MFSGKTAELQRRLRRAVIAKLHIGVFKPAIDTRFGKNTVTSHDNIALEALAVSSSKEIISKTEGMDVVGIDEAQFFDDELVDVCEDLANQGKRVIVSGLDIDSFGKPFGPMPGIMAKAEFITKLHAICIKCGELAHYSHRKATGNKKVVLGAEEAYEALCRLCYNQIKSK